jgi:hypothetical protein
MSEKSVCRTSFTARENKEPFKAVNGYNSKDESVLGQSLRRK